MGLFFALLMTITVNGQTTEYVIDRNMSLGDCWAAAKKHRGDTVKHHTVTIARSFECKAVRKGDRF